MSGDALSCSACGYENVVAGCGFCLQCGAEFDTPPEVALTPAAPVTASSPAAESPPLQDVMAAAPTPNDAPSGVPTPEAVGTGVASTLDEVASPAASDQPDDAIRLSAQSDVIPVPSGGTTDFQSAIASAEQCDYENGHWEDDADANSVGGTADVVPPAQDGLAVEDIAPTPPNPMVAPPMPRVQLPEVVQLPVSVEPQAEQIPPAEITPASAADEQTSEQAATQQPENGPPSSPGQPAGDNHVDSAVEGPHPSAGEHQPIEAQQPTGGPDLPSIQSAPPVAQPDNQVIPAEAAPIIEAAATAETVEVEATPVEATPVEAAEVEAAEVEAAEVEAAEVEAAEVEAAEVEAAEVEPAEVEAVEVEAARPESTPAEIAAESVHAKVVQPEPVHVEPVQPEMAQPESFQHGNVAQADVVAPEYAQPEVAQPETNEFDDVTQAQAAQAAGGPVETAQLEATPLGAAELELRQAKAVPPVVVPQAAQRAMDSFPDEASVPQATQESYDDGFDFPVESTAPVAATVAAASEFDDPATETNSEPDSEGPISFSKSLAHELHATIVAAADAADMRLREEDDRLVAQLIIGGRPQSVYIERTFTSDATPVLSLYAVCGPASTKNALPLLEWNRALALCAFAVRDVGDRKMFVIQSNLLAFSVDHSTLRRTLVEIAKRANQVNERLL